MLERDAARTRSKRSRNGSTALTASGVTRPLSTLPLRAVTSENLKAMSFTL